MPTRPSWRPLVAGTVALFFVILAFLAGQLKSGGDPALGRSSAVQQQTSRAAGRRLHPRRHRAGPRRARRLLVRPDHPPVMTQVDLAFPSMGGEARVRLESVLFDEAELATLADGIHSQIEAVEAALSRFNPDSELSLLNRDPRPAVPASPLLRRAVAAALWAADYSDGLVDATLLGELELAGYTGHWEAAERADVDVALASAPPRRPAAPAVWRVRDRLAPRRRGAGRAGAGRAARPRRDRQGHGRRPRRRLAPRGRPLRDLVRRRPRGRRRAAVGRRGPQRAQRDRGPPAAGALGRHRDVGHRRADLADRGRPLRPPRDRPRDGPPGLDRPGGSDRGGRQRARGRGAREGRAALRPARRAAVAAAPRRRAPARRRPRGDRAGAGGRAAAAARSRRETRWTIRSGSRAARPASSPTCCSAAR